MKLRSLLTLIPLLIIVLGTFAPGAAAQCNPSWQVVYEPPAQANGLNLLAVAANAANNSWAVGAYQPDNTFYQTAALHWDGSRATLIASPNALAGGVTVDNRLAAVSARAADDVWAVGWHGAIIRKGNREFAGSQSLVEHWNGSQWSLMPAPERGPDRGSHLQAVAAIGPNDVWAAGRGEDETVYTPLIAHWDGQSWRESAFDVPNGELTGLAAFGANDVWAVGSYQQDASTGPLLGHWNGSGWSVTKLPIPAVNAGQFAQFYLRSLVGGSGSDVWAVGSLSVFRPSNQPRVPPIRVSLETYILHWNGSAWTRVASPNPGSGGDLFSVSASSNNSALAVGYAASGDGTRALALRWNGSAWAEESTPAQSSLASVAALPSGEALALTTNNRLLRYAAVCGNPTPTPTPGTGGSNPTAPVADPNDPNVTYFKPVQHTLRGVFRDYWNQYGGLAQFGYPLTEEFQEVSPTNGQTYTVQYFERNRFEYHPENQPPYNVLLGLLGRTITKGRENETPFKPVPETVGGGRYFKATGHLLAPQFLAYWEQHGGLAVFGYPISEAFFETSPTNGKTYIVQYFERNRFEYHPENNAPYDVLLGLLGVQVLKERGWIR